MDPVSFIRMNDHHELKAVLAVLFDHSAPIEG